MMEQIGQLVERRTGADVVFDYLYDEIVSLRLLPGAKISEAEIASRFDVSRQPVRDAFSRLGNLDLLQIRPQRATEVKRFSYQSIQTARFVRAAVELEVLHHAVRVWDGSMEGELQDNLDAQSDAIEALDIEAFHTLDYRFHQLLCKAGQVAFAFDEIAQKKAMVDRLCVLSLMHHDRMVPLLDDHRRIVSCIRASDEAAAVEACRTHLSRLDKTIDSIRGTHAEYFED